MGFLTDTLRYGPAVAAIKAAATHYKESKEEDKRNAAMEDKRISDNIDRYNNHIRHTLPEDPKERRVIVLLNEEDIINSSDSEWINSSKITVLKYPFDRDSPIYENELYKSLDDADLIEQGAILVQSPYDLNVYRDAKDAEELINFNALRKYNLFARFCQKLGATRIQITHEEGEQKNTNSGGGGQVGYNIVEVKGGASKESEEKLRQTLERGSTFNGNPNPNIEEAEKYLFNNRLDNDEVLKDLLEARKGSNKVKSYTLSYSIASDSMQSLKLVGGIKIASFNAEGNYENAVRTLKDKTVSFNIEFGAG